MEKEKENKGKRLKTEIIDVSKLTRTIPVACSWCNKIYHLKHWQIEEGRRSGISHGMCPDCEKKQVKELERLGKLTGRK